jgi:hypothetical protein
VAGCPEQIAASKVEPAVQLIADAAAQLRD